MTTVGVEQFTPAAGSTLPSVSGAYGSALLGGVTVTERLPPMDMAGQFLVKATMVDQARAQITGAIHSGYLEQHSVLLIGESWRSPSRSRSMVVKSSRREEELRWLQTNRDKLKSLAGQWVVIGSEGIVTSGKYLSEVVAEAKRQGIRSPVVHRVAPEPRPGEADMGI